MFGPESHNHHPRKATKRRIQVQNWVRLALKITNKENVVRVPNVTIFSGQTSSSHQQNDNNTPHHVEDDTSSPSNNNNSSVPIEEEGEEEEVYDEDEIRMIDGMLGGCLQNIGNINMQHTGPNGKQGIGEEKKS